MTDLIIAEPVDELTGSVNLPLKASLSNQSRTSYHGRTIYSDVRSGLLFGIRF